MDRSVKWQTIALVLMWGLAFIPVFPDMVVDWFSHTDNSHALLVPLISLYFVWAKRHEIYRSEISTSWLGLGIMIVSLIIYLLSYAGGIAVFSRLMMISSLIGLLWYFLGTPIIRLMAFPLCFLFFMVPIPITLLGLVAFPLQLIATKISANLIQFCSIPVYREGNMLFFLQTQLEVAEACSGIRSIMSLTMLSVVFSYVSSGRWWINAILILSALPVAMTANIIRVSGTGVLAHFFGGQVARGFLHEFSGLVVFVFGLVVLLLEFKLLEYIGTRKYAK